MRIEEITLDVLRRIAKESTASELKQLRQRFNSVFWKYFKNTDSHFVMVKCMGEEVRFTRRDLFRKYRVVRDEMNTRGIENVKETELDRKTFRWALKGYDATTIGDLVVQRNAVSLSGNFIKGRSGVDSVTVLLRTLGEDDIAALKAAVEQRMRDETDKEPVVVIQADEPTEAYIPLYDLVLVPKKAFERKEPVADTEDETVEEYICKYCESPARWIYLWKDALPQSLCLIYVCHSHRLKARHEFERSRGTECIVKSVKEFKAAAGDDETEIKKPYPTEHAARLQDPGKFEKFRRTAGGKLFNRIDVPKTIGIIWGKFKGREGWTAQALRFDKKAWTETAARKWLKDNQVKAILFEPAVEKAAALLTVLPETVRRKEHEVLMVQDTERFTDIERVTGKYIWGGVELPADVVMLRAQLKGWEEDTWSDMRYLVGLRFPASSYTVAQVKTWLKENSVYHTEIREAQEDVFKFDIVKADKAQQIVGGIVYEPDAVDTHGDYTTGEEIQKAMYLFMEKYSKGGGELKVQHKGKDYGFPILEVFQPEADTNKGGQTVKKGAWWMMVKVTDATIWKAIEAGKLTGFSMGGTARV